MPYSPHEDLDLKLALSSAGCDIELEEIAEVIASLEGEPDLETWYWVVITHTGDYWLLIGHCCFHGWDCQGSLESTKITQWSQLKERCMAVWEYIEPQCFDYLQAKYKPVQTEKIVEYAQVNEMVAKIDVAHSSLELVLELIPEWQKEPILYVHAYLYKGNHDFAIHMWLVETFNGQYVYVEANTYGEHLGHDSACLWATLNNADQLKRLVGFYADELLAQVKGTVDLFSKQMAVLTGLVKAIVERKMATTTIRPAEQVLPYRVAKSFEKSEKVRF